MAFRKILVPLTGAASDGVALASAFAVARPFNGHVQALFVVPDPREAVPFVGMPVAPEVVQQLIDNAESIAQAARKAARANLNAMAKDAKVPVLDAPATDSSVTCSLREMQGGFLSEVVQAARLCDLVVFGPATLEGGPDISAAFIETLTEGERPVLLAPEKPVAGLKGKAVIGWDGSGAAANALSAALPLLHQADAVEVLSVQTASRDTGSLAEAIEYLSLHGVVATPRVVDPGEATPGAVLLREAAKDEASLLVLGGYGHSRLLETLFGGTTVHVTAHATLPLFMVH